MAPRGGGERQQPAPGLGLKTPEPPGWGCVYSCVPEGVSPAFAGSQARRVPGQDLRTPGQRVVPRARARGLGFRGPTLPLGQRAFGWWQWLLGTARAGVCARVRAVCRRALEGTADRRRCGRQGWPRTQEVVLKFWVPLHSGCRGGTIGRQKQVHLAGAGSLVQKGPRSPAVCAHARGGVQRGEGLPAGRDAAAGDVCLGQGAALAFAARLTTPDPSPPRTLPQGAQASGRRDTAGN